MNLGMKPSVSVNMAGGVKDGLKEGVEVENVGKRMETKHPWLGQNGSTSLKL